jgi:hypothetical protein
MNKNWQAKHKPTFPFLETFFQKMKIKTSTLVFCGIWIPKIAYNYNGRWLRGTGLIGEEGYLYYNGRMHLE